MRINKEFVLREIAGEYIIIPIGTTAQEFNGLITVNEIGSLLWNKLQEEITLEELVLCVTEEYEVEKEVAQNDIEEFLEKLEQAGILNAAQR